MKQAIYKVNLYRTEINNFHTFRAADKFARAYNKLNKGMHNGASVETEYTETVDNAGFDSKLIIPTAEGKTVFGCVDGTLVRAHYSADEYGVTVSKYECPVTGLDVFLSMRDPVVLQAITTADAEYQARVA